VKRIVNFMVMVLHWIQFTMKKTLAPDTRELFS
jgi:hypothetical protein